MKKTFLYRAVMTIAITSIVMMAGCQKKESPAQAPAAAQTGTAAPNDITVRLLTDATGVDDKSFNASGWRGILDFYGDTWNNTAKRGNAYDVVTAQTHDMFVPNLRQASDEGYDLIATTGFTWSDAVAQVAKDYPSQKYLIVDVDWMSGDNIMQAAYAEHEGSYLVGLAAALKAKEDGIANPRFGFIGGVPGAVITKFEVGYAQGVLSIIPDAQIVDYYVNSWGEPALAKTQAKNWYDSGVYAIYSAAGGSGNGTIAQAKEYRLDGKNVWAIGVDSDQYEEGLYNANESAVLTSMLKRVDISLVYGLNAVKSNSFKGEVVVFDMAKGGVDYAKTNQALGSGIVAEIDSVKQKIINGEITIAATNAAAKQLPGFPQNLKALDD